MEFDNREKSSESVATYFFTLFCSTELLESDLRCSSNIFNTYDTMKFDNFRPRRSVAYVGKSEKMISRKKTHCATRGRIIFDECFIFHLCISGVRACIAHVKCIQWQFQRASVEPSTERLVNMQFKADESMDKVSLFHSLTRPTINETIVCRHFLSLGSRFFPTTVTCIRLNLFSSGLWRLNNVAEARS